MTTTFCVRRGVAEEREETSLQLEGAELHRAMAGVVDTGGAERAHGPADLPAPAAAASASVGTRTGETTQAKSR